MQDFADFQWIELRLGVLVHPQFGLLCGAALPGAFFPRKNTSLVFLQPTKLAEEVLAKVSSSDAASLRTFPDKARRKSWERHASISFSLIFNGFGWI